MKNAILALLLLIVFSLAYSLVQGAELPVDSRYCGSPQRNSQGIIIRSQTEIKNFEIVHPCPVNGQSKGACEGWEINHVIPLACGGCDAINNMQWLPKDIKRCAGSHCVDRYERKVYAKNIKDTDACKTEFVK